VRRFTFSVAFPLFLLAFCFATMARAAERLNALANKARQDLGDDATDTPGKNIRKPALTKDAKPLTNE